MFVSRVVQTGLPEVGTLLAHICGVNPAAETIGGWHTCRLWGDQVDALEGLINLFGSIDLEWSQPPGSNRRPADYESGLANYC